MNVTILLNAGGLCVPGWHLIVQIVFAGNCIEYFVFGLAKTCRLVGVDRRVLCFKIADFDHIFNRAVFIALDIAAAFRRFETQRFIVVQFVPTIVLQIFDDAFSIHVFGPDCLKPVLGIAVWTFFIIAIRLDILLFTFTLIRRALFSLIVAHDALPAARPLPALYHAWRSITISVT